MTAVESESGEELKRVLTPGLLLLFVVGDIIGAGVYAVTGDMAGYVGGIVWLPFVVAFAVAGLTALSYLELVTRYPQAAGAALYTHKAFGVHLLTFMVAFAVICSGIASASTSSNVLAANLTSGLVANGWMSEQSGTWLITAIAAGFMVLLAVINLRGVGESAKFNVVLTLVQMAALTIVIGVGFLVIGRGDGDLSRVTTFEDAEGRGLFLAVAAATSIAFFALVGFEDSVNLAEEVERPAKTFPKVLLAGLGITLLIYVLVAIAVVTVLTPEQIADAPEGGALLSVVAVGTPDLPIDRIFPFLVVFAVANTALINMLMASRLLYGMARQGVLPRVLGRVSATRRSPWAGVVFATLLALALIVYVSVRSEDEVVVNLASVTALLLLGVFTVVNLACLVVRRRTEPGAFRSPGLTPLVAAVACAFLVGPWVDRQRIVYEIALGLLALGLVLWGVTWVVRRVTGGGSAGFSDVEHLEDEST